MDKSSVLTRRPIFLGLIVLAGSVFLTGISPLFPARAQAETLAKPAPAAADKVKTFSAKHLWDAKVEIGEVAELGESRYGVRRMIPITGGTFAGANIRGTVLAGGADFQLTRTDGDTELLANYMLKTQDGFIIQMTNRALSHDSIGSDQANKKNFYSVIDLEAPANSPYEYLNHAIYLGTLEVPKWKAGEKPNVIVGVYQLL